MKILDIIDRTKLEQLDEVTRRGFLKGMVGAAAISLAGAIAKAAHSADAVWHKMGTFSNMTIFVDLANLRVSEDLKTILTWIRVDYDPPTKIGQLENVWQTMQKVKVDCDEKSVIYLAAKINSGGKIIDISNAISGKRIDPAPGSLDDKLIDVGCALIQAMAAKQREEARDKARDRALPSDSFGGHAYKDPKAI